MKKIRKLYRKYPIAGGIIAAALIIGFMKLNGMLMKTLAEGMTREYLLYGFNILAAYCLVRLLGYRWIYRRGDAAGTFMAGLPYILIESLLLAGTILAAFTAPDTVWKPLPGILLGILKLFQIGFLEESIFRGVIANGIGIRYGKDSRGVWATALMSGLIFGAMHLSNMTSGIRFSSAFAQSVIACILGTYLAAVYLRGGNIWIMILIHSITDSIGLFGTSFTEIETTDVDAVNAISFQGAAFFLIFLLLAAFLLRRSKMPEVIANLEGAKQADKDAQTV